MTDPSTPNPSTLRDKPPRKTMTVVRVLGTLVLAGILFSFGMSRFGTPMIFKSAARSVFKDRVAEAVDIEESTVIIEDMPYGEVEGLLGEWDYAERNMVSSEAGGGTEVVAAVYTWLDTDQGCVKALIINDEVVEAMCGDWGETPVDGLVEDPPNS